MAEPDLGAQIASRIGFWAYVCEIQRERVADRSAGQFVNQADATLLAIAIRDVIRSAKWAAVLSPEVVDAALATFDSKVPRAQALRDMIEHFDEYGVGTGRLQKTSEAGPLLEFTMRYKDVPTDDLRRVRARCPIRCERGSRPSRDGAGNSHRRR